MKTETQFSFPATLPEIEITRLDEPPFEVECRELRWWFIVPEVGQRGGHAYYEYPDGALYRTYAWEGVNIGKVHERDSCEIRFRDWDPNGHVRNESYAYGLIHEGISRWDAWWHIGMPQLIYSYLEDDFNHDWGASPSHILDMGLYHWVDETHVEKTDPPSVDPKVDPIGAGMCRVRIGAKEYRCLRVLDLDEESIRLGILIEAFLNEEGRAVLLRRYNAPQYRLEGGVDWEMLADSPTLTCNGVPHRLWGVNLPEASL